jgi:hypothetical protein
MRNCACAVLLALLPGTLFGQSTETQPRFEIADVHISAKTPNQFVRTGPVRNRRYEIRTATMLDLVRVSADGR